MIALLMLTSEGLDGLDVIFAKASSATQFHSPCGSRWRCETLHDEQATGLALLIYQGRSRTLEGVKEARPESRIQALAQLLADALAPPERLLLCNSVSLSILVCLSACPCTIHPASRPDYPIHSSPIEALEHNLVLMPSLYRASFVCRW